MTENTNDNVNGVPNASSETEPTAPFEGVAPVADATAQTAEMPVTQVPTPVGPTAEEAQRTARTNRIILGVGGGVLAVALLIGTFGAGLAVGSHFDRGRGPGRAGMAQGMDPRGGMQGFDGQGRGDDGFGRGKGGGGRGGMQQFPGAPGQGQGQGQGGQQGVPQGHPDFSNPPTSTPQSYQPNSDGTWQ